MSRKLQLELLEHHPIRDAASGLNEPSGLALDRQGTSLYTVSDDTRIIFNLDLQGRIIPNSSFLINVKDLEGLAVTADDKTILAVQEESNSIIQFDIFTRKEIQQIPLATLKNYDQIAVYFTHADQNKGLEGITINFNNNHIFIVKEGAPAYSSNSTQNAKRSSTIASLMKNMASNIQGLNLKSSIFQA